MRYHYFIKKTSDLRYGVFDLLVVVPVFRTASENQSRWQRFVGASGMHSFLSVPLNAGKLRFRLSTVTVDNRVYPVIRVESSSVGVFQIPFLPSRVGGRQAFQTYLGIMEMARAYHRHRQRKQVGNLGATGTGGALTDVVLHPSSIERIADQEMEEFTGVLAEAGGYKQQVVAGKNRKAVNRQNGGAAQDARTKQAKQAKQAIKNKQAKMNTGKPVAKRAGAAKWLRIVGAGAALGMTGALTLAALSPAANAAEPSNAETMDKVEPVESQEKSVELLPVPELDLDVAKAKAYQGCSVGSLDEVALKGATLPGLNESLDAGS